MQTITVQTIVNAPIERVWDAWTNPKHIIHWCQASDDWHAPRAENDIRTDGKFLTRMEARDGSVGFDFGGTYTAVTANEKIEYAMDDGRKVSISFIPQGDGIKITETFDAESQNSIELQRDGWQAILENFKKYTEGK